MAIHYTVPSLIQESLVEKLLVAKYCIEYRKDPAVWGSNGCYGHPALVLLLSIADSIGSYVIDTSDVRNHFKILNCNDYYGLSLTKGNIDTIYKQYRCLSNHNSVIGLHTSMDIGSPSNGVLETQNEMPVLYLRPLYEATQKAVTHFLENVESVFYESKQLRRIFG